MTRYSSVLRHAAHEARTLLREELASGLRTNAQPRDPREGQADDRAILDLLSVLQVEDPWAEQAFVARYEESRARAPGAESLGALVTAGWLQLGFDRVHVSGDLRRALKSAPGTISWAAPLQRALPAEEVALAVPSNTVVPEALANALQGEGTSEGIRRYVRTTRDPMWVAARLWEHARFHVEETVRLSWWFFRWKLLGSPFIVPSHAWTGAAHIDFVDQCVKRLGDANLPSWARARDHAAVAMILRAERFDLEAARKLVPEPGEGWIQRYEWIESKQVRFDPLDGYRDYGALMWLCLEDAIAAAHGSAPHPIVRRLTPFIERSPHLLWTLGFRARASPVLLADFAMNPATAGWAARVVAQWSGVDGGGAWDVGLAYHRREGRRRAYDAIVAVLAHHVSGHDRDNAIPELVALLQWLEVQRLARDIYGRKQFDHELVEVTWRLLPLADIAVVQPLLAQLTALVQSETCPVGEPSFGVALRVLDHRRAEGGTPGLEVAIALVDGYCRSVAAPSHGTEDGFPDAALLRLAAVDETLVERVLSPFPFERAARDAFYLDPEVRLDRVRKIRSGLRTHVRFLAACLSDATCERVDAVVDAMVHHALAGSRSNLERGRVDALGLPEGALWSNAQDPLPSLLGEALRLLNEEHRKRLLTTFTESDDPTFLARLLSAGPPTVRDALRSRLNDLGPENAADVVDLPSLRFRRNALLEAGEVRLASVFFQHEKGASTFGPVAGRRADEFAFELRVLLTEGCYDDIVSRTVAADEWSNDEERRTAERTLGFYRALSEMCREQGNLAEAERILATMSKRDPTSLAAAINLNAVRIKRAVQDGASRGAAASLEADAARLLERSELGESDRHTLEANLALLDAHTGHYQRALNRLRALPGRARFALQATATAVHALVELGEQPEARLWVETAARWAGWTAQLKALRESVEAPRTIAVLEVSSVRSEPSAGERRAAIGSALDALRRLPIEEQAYIASGGRDLEAHLCDLLSQAAAALQDHSPSLVQGVSVPHFEDNLTRMMASLISPSVSCLGWSLHLHPHRGGTARDPTIPDMVLKHGEEVVAIVEAVWGPRPVMTADVQRELKKHLVKTFSYGPSSLFFHVIYTRGGNLLELLAELARLAQHESPQDFDCLGHPSRIEELGKPPRVVSTHRNPHSAERLIRLTQFVIDLGRASEDAARASNAS
jgi:hypothetical protein